MICGGAKHSSVSSHPGTAVPTGMSTMTVFGAAALSAAACAAALSAAACAAFCLAIKSESIIVDSV